MQNLKLSVVSALLTNVALTTLISDRVYFHYPNDFTSLPCISYFEVNNSGVFFCDDVEVGSEIIFQIDIWGTASTTAIAAAIDSVMVSEEFVRISSIDLFESDTKIHHKSMKYQNNYIV